MKPYIANTARFAFALTLLAVVQTPPAFSGMVESGNVSTPKVLPSDAEGDIVVKFRKGTPRSERLRSHTAADASVLSEVRALGTQRVKSRRGESTQALLQRYRSDPRVEYAEPTVRLRARVIPNDPGFPDLWGLHNTGQSGGTVDADIDAPEAWDSQIGSPGVAAAVVDSGVDYNHPDLAANMWTNPGETPGNGIDDDGNGYIDDVRGWDFVNNDNNPFDDYGHGTHVAGTIAAVGNNAVGVTGVSWQSRTMPLKFLDAAGDGLSIDAADAIVYAAEMGAKVVNASWGCHGSGCFSQVIEDAIVYANAAGVLIVAAAGNDGLSNDAVSDYPCDSVQSNVLCVASTTRNDLRSSFSNYGATTVDLGAPGSAILSTVPVGPCAFCDPSRYIVASGTSMAAPHVSGAASLIHAQFLSYTVAQVRDAILTSVDPLASLAGITVTGGRLNIRKALMSSFTVTAVPASQTVNAGDSTTYTVTVTSEDMFSGPVPLTLGSIAPNLSGSFSPSTVTVPAGGSATSTLTVTAQAGIATGNYLVVIRGTASGEVHTAAVTVVIPAPDLAMTTVTPLATTVVQGSSLDLSNTVQNQGGSNAGSFVIAFHLSVDAVYGGTDDVALAPTRSVSSLAWGSSSGETTPVTVPFTTSPGAYHVCVMADSGGTITESTEGNNALCNASTIQVTAATLNNRLVNISTRAFVGTGSNAAVGGFIISGSGTKQVLIRGFGPTLTSFGVSGALGNSIMDLEWDDDSNPNTPAILVLTNDDWGIPVTTCNAPVVSCGSPQDILDTGLSADSYAPTNPNRALDAALLLTLPPGTYTATLRGVGSGTGVGLIGLDDLDISPTADLINISTRAFVGTGSSAGVGGFIIAGPDPKTVLIRGFGPTLTSFGVAGALGNPTLDLEWDHDSNPNTAAILVLTNNDWGTALGSCPAPVVACGTPTNIVNTGLSADSYAPSNPNRGLDAALLVTLPPGTYTVTLRGVSNGTGVGLIGVDEVGP